MYWLRTWEMVRRTDSKDILMVISYHHPSSSKRRVVIGLRIIHYSSSLEKQECYGQVGIGEVCTQSFPLWQFRAYLGERRSRVFLRIEARATLSTHLGSTQSLRRGYHTQNAIRVYELCMNEDEDIGLIFWGYLDDPSFSFMRPGRLWASYELNCVPHKKVCWSTCECGN